MATPNRLVSLQEKDDQACFSAEVVTAPHHPRTKRTWHQCSEYRPAAGTAVFWLTAYRFPEYGWECRSVSREISNFCRDLCIPTRTTISRRPRFQTFPDFSELQCDKRNEHSVLRHEPYFQECCHPPQWRTGHENARASCLSP